MINPDDIWRIFSEEIANVELSQRATKHFSDSELSRIEEQEKIIEEKEYDKIFCSSHEKLFFTDIRNDKKVHYCYRMLDSEARKMQVILKKNREYQCLIMEAYEYFEDAIENIYAYLGKNDINFWPMSEYGNKKYNDISSLDFGFYLGQAEKRKGGAISIAKDLIDRFNQNIEYKRVKLKTMITVVEKIRHIVVHKGGRVDNKEMFIEKVAKDCGVSVNSEEYKNLTSYIEYFFGGGEYSNIINLTEERIKIHEPIFVEKNRFRAMLNPMLCCVYILYGKSKKYIEKNV